MIEDKLPQTLDEVREAIDGLDKELIELLARRQKLVRQAGRLKPQKTETTPFPFQTTSRPFFPQNRPTSGASDETPSRLTGLVKIMDTF